MKINPKTQLLALGLGLASQNLQAVNRNIDVAFFYDDSMVATFGDSEDCAKAQILTTIEGASLIFQDSKINQQVNLVSLRRVPTPEAENLPYWSAGDQPNGQGGTLFDDFRAVGADYFAFATTRITERGLGFASLWGNTTLLKRSGLNSAVFAHEMGHSGGVNHDKGYVFIGESGQQYRTLMEKNGGPGMTINRFSDPNQTYEGVPIGTAEKNVVSLTANRFANLAKAKTVQPHNSLDGAPYAVRNRVTGKVITLRGGNTDYGTIIDQWDDVNQRNQEWYFGPPNNNGFTFFRYGSNSRNSVKFLGILDESNNGGATLQPWNGVQQNVRFKIEHLDNGFVQFKNEASGKVIFPTGDQNGARIRQWTDRQQPTTQWHLEVKP